MCLEGVHHKHPAGCGLIPSQFVLHDQSVVAVVHVGGLVEEETSVFLWPVGRVGDELGESEGGTFEFVAFVAPADVRFRISIHSKWETPVMLLDGVPQEDDFDWNCWEMTDLRFQGWLEKKGRSVSSCISKLECQLGRWRLKGKVWHFGEICSFVPRVMWELTPHSCLYGE